MRAIIDGYHRFLKVLLTVLMTVLPAKIAGVGDVVVASPAGPDGTSNEVLLGAAGMAGADELIVTGGAQAIGALAYGTETVAPVDMIVGPGNAWVTAAKLAVFGVCGIDLPAGPSESLELVDGTADATIVAADLICQAEHGPDSQAVLVTTAKSLVTRVQDQIAKQLKALDRARIAKKALAKRSALVLAKDINQCIELANIVRIEVQRLILPGIGKDQVLHDELDVADAADALFQIEHLCAAFVEAGAHTPPHIDDIIAQLFPPYARR